MALGSGSAEPAAGGGGWGTPPIAQTGPASRIARVGGSMRGVSRRPRAEFGATQSAGSHPGRARAVWLWVVESGAGSVRRGAGSAACASTGAVSRGVWVVVDFGVPARALSACARLLVRCRDAGS
eukprot:scaffold11416_cov119-Isochrysis_galbana.AAC.4